MFPSRETYPVIVGLTAFVLAACGGSGGGGASGLSGGKQWLIPKGQVVDGGPGVDGIPAINEPVFQPASQVTTIDLDETVAVLRHAGDVKVYPEAIMNYHEIVNDGPPDDPIVFSFCPLTGSAMAWRGTTNHADPTYGVSGLLYNANLLLYDRESDSLWSQMLQQSVNGPRIGERPETLQVVETKFSTLLESYPDALVLTRDTGHVREYDINPYGAYPTSGNLIFQVAHTDNRLFPKARIAGIYSGNNGKVYQIPAFGPTTRVINDEFLGQSIVVVGNSDREFGVIYNRRLPDGTVLTFSAVQDDLPNVMTDDEGNVWDIFGVAVSGPRAGQQLGLTSSYRAMWFAWVAFFHETEIYFN